MTKSKNSIINRSITYVTTFPAVVTESTFCLLPLGRFLLPLSIMNKHILSGSSSHFLLTTSFWNVSIAIHWMFLATIPLLDFVTCIWFIEFSKMCFGESPLFFAEKINSKNPPWSQSHLTWVGLKSRFCHVFFLSFLLSVGKNEKYKIIICVKN